MKKITIFVLIIFIPFLVYSEILIPMDFSQTDHLKAYGIVYKTLEKGYDGKWLLNYRGGSFLIPETDEFEVLCRLKGVSYDHISPMDYLAIEQTIEKSNMDIVYLEKAPKIAVYTLPES
ncbi:MAG: asparagine synthetase B, partial [Candidatus Celaenobacter antarcticus]|nr:asparagine synthetase B [Candidatus Celaenobacter antarcticus]